MRVIVPYTTLHPVTKAVLEGYRLPSLTFVQLSRDDHAYQRLLAFLWRQRETIIIVEHDVAPWPGCLEELHQCPAEWCSCSYAWTNAHGRTGVGLHHMLGCTKLSSELMAALPNLWDEPCHWTDCDKRLFFAARDIAKEPHPHRPSVVHLKGISAAA